MKILTTTAFATLIAAGLAFGASAEIRIGATISETGPRRRFLGEPGAKTLKMLVDKVNSAGGISGEEIALTLYDDGGDPNKARTFAPAWLRTTRSLRSSAAQPPAPPCQSSRPPRTRNPVHLARRRHRDNRSGQVGLQDPAPDRMACQKIFEDMTARGITKIGMISGTGWFPAPRCASSASTWWANTASKSSPTRATAPPTPTRDPAAHQHQEHRRHPGRAQPGFGQGPSVVTRNYQQLAVGLPLYQSHGVASKGFIELAGPEAAEGVRLPVLRSSSATSSPRTTRRSRW